MVIPIIGARDYVDQRGFMLHECERCRTLRVFSVYDTRRKLTFYFIPTKTVRTQVVMECMTCHEKWGIPDNRLNELAPLLMTQEQLSHRIDEMNREAQRRTIASNVPSGQRLQRTLYQTLQVDPEADSEVIEAAFRRLALKYHPDRTTEANAEERMREILTAKDVLLDPQQRQRYDRSLGIERRIDGLRHEDV